MPQVSNTILIFKDIVSKYNISLPKISIPEKPVRKLMQLFQSVADVRVLGKVVYPLKEIVMVAFLAIISGAGTFTEIEVFGKANEDKLLQYFKITHGIPSHDTFRRVLSLIDPIHLQKATVSFLMHNIALTIIPEKINTTFILRHEIS